MAGQLSETQLGRMQAYWDAANYLVVGQIYLQDNPLLREPYSEIYPEVTRDTDGLRRLFRQFSTREALRRARRSVPNAEDLIRKCDAQLARHHDDGRQHLDDIPEIRDWVWTD